MDILRQSLAPISDAAWAAIHDQAKRTLKGNLSARKLVDFSGPRGMDFSAVGMGLLDCTGKKSVGGVEWGVRRVLPLIELRVPFTLGIWDLDNVARGSKAPDLVPVETAARKAAIFEEKALYFGFKDGEIDGIASASAHKPVALNKTAAGYPAAVEQAVLSLQGAGIGGDYALVLGTQPYQVLVEGDEKGYPLVKRVKQIIGGEIRWSPAVKGGVLLSTAGGFYELTVGQDYAIGYLGHDAENVKLYLTASYTFQVLEPRAAVELKVK